MEHVMGLALAPFCFSELSRRWKEESRVSQRSRRLARVSTKGHSSSSDNLFLFLEHYTSSHLFWPQGGKSSVASSPGCLNHAHTSEIVPL